MKRAWVFVFLAVMVAGCAGSRSMGYESDEGVTLYVERPEEGLAKGERLPEPDGGWRALAEEVEFPEMAKSARVKGEVLVDLAVDEAGNVLSVDIIEALGYGCEKAIQDAVARTACKPGTVDGTPAAKRVSLVFAFERKLEVSVSRVN